jgi:hypothetical protein
VIGDNGNNRASTRSRDPRFETPNEPKAAPSGVALTKGAKRGRTDAQAKPPDAAPRRFDHGHADERFWEFLDAAAKYFADVDPKGPRDETRYAVDGPGRAYHQAMTTGIRVLAVRLLP